MSLNDSNSSKLFKEAKRYIPGGVNSPVRALKAVGREPIFVKRAKGSKLYDVDGNVYTDYVCSWGPLILGHSHPQIVEAVKDVIGKGSSYGAPTEVEVKIAKEIVEAVSSIEKIRMVNSGTEAVMSAIRLARAFSKKEKIVKFSGCYHGHVDSMLVKAGSGATTFTVPDSQGLVKEEIEKTLITPYNDADGLEEILKRNKDVAAVIIEPVAGNMGVVAPKEEFLKRVRELTEEAGVLLIFDEVITGFRLCYGGAQDYFKVKPDLTCLGKIIGGGFPVGAYGGRNDIIDLVTPDGPVYQAGTLSGNSVAMTAGLETLKILKQEKVYNELKEKMKILEKGIPGNIFFSHVESMFTLFYAKEVHDYDSAKKCNTKAYADLFNKLLENGIYFPPSQYESAFLSTAHSKEELEKLISVL